MIELKYKNIWQSDEDKAILSNLNDYLNEHNAEQYGINANGNMSLASQSFQWWFSDGRKTYYMVGRPPKTTAFSSFVSEHEEEIVKAKEQGCSIWLSVKNFSPEEQEKILNRLIDCYSCNGEIQDEYIVLEFQ